MVTEPNLTKFMHNVEKSLQINLTKSKFQYSNPFQNASVLNEGSSSNYGRVVAQFLLFNLYSQLLD